MLKPLFGGAVTPTRGDNQAAMTKHPGGVHCCALPGCVIFCLTRRVPAGRAADEQCGGLCRRFAA